MKITEKAAEVLKQIEELFEDPATLAEGLAFTYIQKREGDKGRPIDRWSWRNRLLAWVSGTTDARTFKQWKGANRSVCKGAKAFPILGPITYTVKDEEDDGEEGVRLAGWRAIPVFRLEDTDGYPVSDPDIVYAPPSLPPLYGVAESWGINVSWVPYDDQQWRGLYNPAFDSIVLATHDERTFLHELAHAADRRIQGRVEHKNRRLVAKIIGALTQGEIKADTSSKAEDEATAELCAAVLGRLYGRQVTDTSWKYIAQFGDVTKLVGKVLPRCEAALNLILEDAAGLPPF